ncbi:MAG: hypothetical protein MZU97_19940 [Bacillus subtilis]|nr:hypothetical protein [Bacillus subtilis]
MLPDDVGDDHDDDYHTADNHDDDDHDDDHDNHHVAELPSPAILPIADNIVTFEGVTGANKYRIRATHTVSGTSRTRILRHLGIRSVLVARPEAMYSFRIKADRRWFPIADSRLQRCRSKPNIKDPNRRPAALEATHRSTTISTSVGIGRTWYDDVNECRNYFLLYGQRVRNFAFYGTELVRDVLRHQRRRSPRETRLSERVGRRRRKSAQRLEPSSSMNR